MSIYDDAAADILNDGILALGAAAALVTRLNPNESLDDVRPEALGALLRLINDRMALGRQKAESEHQELVALRCPGHRPVRPIDLGR